MKTPEEILKEHAPFLWSCQYAGEQRGIIKAMEEYAIQSVETATANAVHQLEMKDEDLSRAEDLIATLQGQVVDVTLERDELDEEYKKATSMLKMTANAHKALCEDFIKFLTHIETYPVQLTPGLRAEIENYKSKLSK